MKFSSRCSYPRCLHVIGTTGYNLYIFFVQNWLANLSAKPSEGANDVHVVTKAGRKIAKGLVGKERDDIIQLCDEIDEMMGKLEEFRTLYVSDDGNFIFMLISLSV